MQELLSRTRRNTEKELESINIGDGTGKHLINLSLRTSAVKMLYLLNSYFIYMGKTFQIGIKSLTAP